MNTKKLAENILKLVGGEKNVAMLVHCATRLRFKIIDNSKVNEPELEALDGVITVVKGSGQLQVVIGNRVSEVFRAFGVISGLLDDNKSKLAAQEQQSSASLLGRLIDLISGIFTPLLGAMAAAGVLKGVLAIVLAAGWMTNKETTYIILHAASDGLFYFLPMLLAITSARKFETDIFVAVSVAGALIYPSIQQLFTAGNQVTFFGLPVMMMKYTGTVIPIIFSVWLMSIIERFLKRHIHESFRNILTPFLLLSLMVPLTLMTIGPVGVSVSESVASIFVSIYSFNPIIASALMAVAWQILVIFGVHWGFVPVFMNDISVMGHSYLKAAVGPSVFAQSGALLAVMLRTKDTKLKALAGSSLIVSLFGITEPGVYGITLKFKKPFICAIIAAGFGGAIVGYAQSSAIAMGITGLLTLPIFYGAGFTGFIIGCIVAFIASLILTLLVGFDDPARQTSSQSSLSAPTQEEKRFVTTKASSGSNAAQVIDEQIAAPISGTVIPLKEVNDKVFSSGVVGEGFAIIPEEGLVHSPVDGHIASTFPSSHAICIHSSGGAEILIHVGLNTVQLEGQYFQMQVKEGDMVQKGQLLLTFNLNEIKKAGYDTVTPVIITNSEAWGEMHISDKALTRSGELVMALSL